MSESKPSPRIIRKESPPNFRVAYRKYFPYLLRDFDKRCAYSGEHLARTGDVAMEIDHHNPWLPEGIRNRYENLFPATRHCNGKKGKRWPSREQKEAGIRFLNPCSDLDYGHHIFEDPETFELWGATPAGVYHIRMLDLNAPHLVTERRNRFRLWALRTQPNIVTLLSSVPEAMRVLDALYEELTAMIPLWPQRTNPRKATALGAA